MAKRRGSSRHVIKEHRPWRGWLFSLLLITVSGIVGWLLSHQISASPELTSPSISSPAILGLQKGFSSLKQENAHLHEQLARTQRELEIEQHAHTDLNASLAALQDKVLALRRQLATYKGLMQSLEEQGLHIQALTISNTATERLLRYRIVLTQGRRMDRLIQGQAQFTIYGIIKGKSTQFKFGHPSKKGHSIAFKFRYFQILDGELLLPKDFKPTQVKVTLLPKNHPSKPVERTFDWASLKD